jgi:GNAT superfamily N-acetyltransferase
MTAPALIRPAAEADIPALHALMHGLAAFERYLDLWAVTPETLRELGFRRDPPGFEALVAESPGEGVVGMLVFQMVPFAMRARPTLYMKELFVAEAARGRGIGEALLRRAAAIALARGCALMKWQVADWNADGRRFYERLGARPDPVWVDHLLDADALRALAESGWSA